MKKFIILSIGLGILFFIWPRSKHIQEEPLLLPRVQVKAFHSIEIPDSIQVTGQTQARRKVNLQSQIPGKIKEIFVEKGQRVSKDQVLMKLDEQDRLERLEEAKTRYHQRILEEKASEKLAAQSFKAENSLAAAQADLASAAAAVAKIENEITHTSIKAPFDGLFDQKFIEIGSTVNNTSSAPLGVVVELDPIKITAQVSEKERAYVPLNSQALVKISVYPDQVFQGKVVYVSATPQQKTRTYTVEVEVPNPDYQLIEGLTAQVTFVDKTIQAHLIPSSVLTLDDQGAIGIKIVEDKKVIFKPIHIIRSTTEGFYVKGLPDICHLIMVGASFVKDGQMVETVESGTT